ncbi:MAG: DNA methyltransferase [Cytophagales bacterium]|nr:DNA methyltransferase [Cytophagales bacterium]
MRKINSSCIDLIYLDPPFNKKKTFTAPIGSHAEGASFRDIFREEDVKEDWIKTIREDHPDLHVFLYGALRIEGKTSYNFCYLAYMAIRLLEMHRILKKTGSIYLHCDQTMSHYLKILMDIIFGEKNFRNEIVWGYDGAQGPSKKDFSKKYDNVFRYSKSDDYQAYELLREERIKAPEIKSSKYKQWTDGRWYYDLPGGNYSEAGVKRLEKEGRIRRTKNGLIRVMYFLRQAGNEYIREKRERDIWMDIHAVGMAGGKQKTNYPTQKPLALLERIIKASSKEGDWVLDPFCGCATTCVAAEKLKRKWIGIDVSIKAYELVKHRLAKEVEGKEEGQSMALFWADKINYQTDPPKRTDQGEDYREKKYIYVISNPKYPGEYKVGVTQDLKKNLSGYQRTDPDRAYKYEYSHLSPQFREIEEHIHEVFPNKHEWVQAPLEEIIAEIERADRDEF